MLIALRQKISRFLRAKDGLAAIEFAFIAPVMFTIYFGVTELSDGMVCSAKVTSVASTAADLVAQQKKMTNSDMADVMAALNRLIYPYPTGTLKIVISSVIDAGSNKTKVAWSDAQNTTARTVGTYVTLPTGLVTSGGGGSVIMAEVSYSYSSPTGNLIYGSYTMSDVFYLSPRQVAQITRSAS